MKFYNANLREDSYDVTSHQKSLLLDNSDEGSSAFNEKQKILKMMREEGLWLKCDCLGEDSPLLSTRLVDDKLFLVNVPNGLPHSSGCRLLVPDRDLTKLAPKMKKPTRAFVMNKTVERGEAEDGPVVSQQKGKSKKPEDSMYRLLAAILTSSGVNEITAKNPAIYKSRVKNIFSKVEGISINSNSMSGRFFWGIRQHKKAVSFAYDKYAKTNDAAAAVSVVMSVISEYGKTKGGSWFVRSVIKAKDDSGHDEVIEVPFEEKVKFTEMSKRTSSTEGPFLLIYNVVQDKTLDFPVVEVEKATVVPISAVSTMLPVDNSFEREVLNLVVGLQREHQLNGVNVRIEKSLLGYDVGDSVAHPNILIRGPYGDAVINCIFDAGIGNEAYANKVQNNNELCKAFGKLFVFKQSEFYSNEFESELGNLKVDYKKLKATLSEIIESVTKREGEL